MFTRERGLTLVELIIFIVVVSIGLLGLLLVMNVTTARSSDPLVRKQLLSIAEALLEEVQLMPFTYCDPDDPNATSATAVAGCAVAEALGPEPSEVRTDPGRPFDNVNDYDGYDSANAGGIRDITGNLMGGLGEYRARIQVDQSDLPGTAFTVAAAASQLITVSVTGPGAEEITLQGWRTRHAPRAP
jgi:MSHA pilin protein MshD